MPWESAPPFALIMVMLGGMGGIQAGVHKLFHGKPKAVGADAWDRATVARDARVGVGAWSGAAGTPAAASKVRGRSEERGRGRAGARWERERGAARPSSLFFSTPCGAPPLSL